MQNTYIWEIEFKDGSKLNKSQNDKQYDKIDPNNPLKQAIYIRLIPQSKTYPKISIKIPKNALPVYARESHMGNMGMGKLKKIVFKVGWNYKRIRHMICMDVSTCEIFQQIDSRGC
jgi:hypothetical protein